VNQVLRRSPRAVFAVLAGLSLVAVALAVFGAFGATGATPRTGPLIVRAGLEDPPGRFVQGSGLYNGKGGGRAELGAAVSGAMMGSLSPVAVSAPDGRYVAYNTWRELRAVDNERSFSRQGIEDGDALGTPSLRVHDDAGRDTLLARGAYSVAWRADGALAYVRGADPDFRAGRVYTGQVVVQRGIHGPAVAWTPEPARYVVYAWAGDRLLFYRLGEGERLELLVADGPGRIRPFADGSAVALSPDGTRVVVLSQDAKSLRVLDVATGREQAWLDVTTTTPALDWVAYSGSWIGDHVVASASPGLAIFRVGPRFLELEQALSLDQARFPVGVQEPRFADDAGNEIVATADVPPKADNPGVSFFLRCDRVDRTCESGGAAPAKEWLRRVDNPSRPSKGGR
jgi:hypothetical protein